MKTSKKTDSSRVKQYEGQEVSPALYIGLKTRYMAAQALKTGLLVEGEEGLPLKWSDI